MENYNTREQTGSFYLSLQSISNRESETLARRFITNEHQSLATDLITYLCNVTFLMLGHAANTTTQPSALWHQKQDPALGDKHALPRPAGRRTSAELRKAVCSMSAMTDRSPTQQAHYPHQGAKTAPSLPPPSRSTSHDILLLLNNTLHGWLKNIPLLIQIF